MRFPTQHVYKDKVTPLPTFFGFSRMQITGVVFVGMLVFMFYMYSMYHYVKSTYGYKPGGVHTVRWAGLVPELEPVMLELEKCGDSLRAAFPDLTMDNLFACDKDGPYGDECEKERQWHLQAILNPSEAGLQFYKDREKRRAKAGPPRCKKHIIPYDNQFPSSLIGPNATLRVVDGAPSCTGEDRYRSQLLGNSSPPDSPAFDVTGGAGELFAASGRISGRFRLDHLEPSKSGGWISGGPCSSRVQKAVETMSKNNPGFLSASASDSFRGLFWYPPGGFDSWHTDSTLLSGWRLYLINVDEDNSKSFFAFQDEKQKWRKVSDSRQRINMFRVQPGEEVWHGVASVQGHRLSLGLGVSDAIAQRILAHLERGHT